MKIGKFPIATALVAVCICPAADAHTQQVGSTEATAVAKAEPGDVSTLFAGLRGEWNCKGAFANGKPLEADLSFSPALGGRGLRYVHVDRSPNTYRQESVWGFDKDSGQLASLAYISFSGPLPSAALYIAASVTDTSATLVHQKLFSDPFAPNRFRYDVTGKDKLGMVWEVRRDNEWRMGDYLKCDRKRPGA